VFQLAGNSTLYFEAKASAFPGMAMLRDGDHVKLTYLDTKNIEAVVNNLELVSPRNVAATQK
jgi:hypothetical protein